MTEHSIVRTTLASKYDDVAVDGLVACNDRNAVYRVRVDGELAACKVADDRGEPLARERAVYETAADETAVPVPQVLAAYEGHLLLDWVDGTTYDGDDSRPVREGRLRAVGRTLARLHRASAGWFDGHGALERGQGQPSIESAEHAPLVVAEPTDWPDRLASFIDDWADRLAGSRDADVAAAVVEFVAEHRDALAGVSPVLVHGEAEPEHVRFDGREVSALLDWELAQAAPPLFDLAWAELGFFDASFAGESDADLREALYDGYGAALPAGESLPADAAFRRHLYRSAFTMRALKHVDHAAERAGMATAALRASMRSSAFDDLAAARAEVAR